MNSSTRGQRKCPCIFGSWQEARRDICGCPPPPVNSQGLSFKRVALHTHTDTRTHTHSPEASINTGLGVENNLLTMSHSNSLQTPLDKCLNSDSAAGCNTDVMRYCLFFGLFFFGGGREHVYLRVHAPMTHVRLRNTYHFNCLPAVSALCLCTSASFADTVIKY